MPEQEPFTPDEWRTLSKVVAFLRREPKPRRIILELPRGGRYVDVLAEVEAEADTMHLLQRLEGRPMKTITVIGPSGSSTTVRAKRIEPLKRTPLGPIVPEFDVLYLDTSTVIGLLISEEDGAQS